MKTMNLAIYNPKGAAGEYARWACNLYKGCPHQCTYCYCRSGFMGTILGGSTLEIKKMLGGNENDAFRIFCKEIDEYGEQIKNEGGLFFSFSTDPMVMDELPLTLRCVEQCFVRSIPVVILTKATEWWHSSQSTRELFVRHKNLVAVGFTLTGCDDQEGSAPPNMDRITLMKELNDCSIKTWASIEPIINPVLSLAMIRQTEDFCNHYKVGLRSGVKHNYYKDEELGGMFVAMEINNMRPTYIKDSFLKRLGIERTTLHEPFVSKDYKLV